MDDPDAVAAAMAVLDRFMAAFNRGDEAGVGASFNFPHVRFHSGRVTIYPTAADYSLDHFRSTSDAKQWGSTGWDERKVISANADKVHFDTRFTRRRPDGGVIATYRSIYIVTRLDGHWGIQGRSTFAP